MCIITAVIAFVAGAIAGALYFRAKGAKLEAKYADQLAAADKVVADLRSKVGK